MLSQYFQVPGFIRAAYQQTRAEVARNTMNVHIPASRVDVSRRCSSGFVWGRWGLLLLVCCGFCAPCSVASAQEQAATQEQQAELNRKVGVARRHWGKAEYDEALTAQAEAVAIAEEVFGLDVIDTIDVVTRQAEWLTASGSWDEAEKAWQKLATLAATLPQHEQWRAVDARLGQAAIVQLRSLPPAQQAEYRDLRVLDQSLRKLADAERPQRRQILQTRLDVLAAALGRNAEQSAAALFDLGNAWLGDENSSGHDNATAKVFLTEALEIREQILGRPHPKTLESAAALCGYALIARDRDHVTPYHTAALEIQKEQWLDRRVRRDEPFAAEPKEPDWRPEGAVKWQAGSVTIAPGNSLETHVSAAPLADFDLSLAFASFQTDGAAAVDIDMFMGSAGWIRVTLRRQRLGGKFRSLVEIHDVIYEIHEGRLVPLPYRKVRSVFNEGDLPSGHWKVRVRYGNVEVYQGDSLIVRGYVDKEPPPVPPEIALSLVPILKDRHLPHLQRRFREIYGSIHDYDVANEHYDLCGDLPPCPQSIKIKPTGLPITWGGFSLVTTVPPADLNEDEKVELVQAKFQTRYFLEEPVVGEGDGDAATAVFDQADMSLDRMKLTSGNHGERCRQQVAEIVGVRHPYYANSLELIALEAESAADWEWAQLLRETACQILRETAGAYHPNYAAALLCLAATNNSAGQFAQAAGRFREAADVFFATEGSKSARAAKSLSGAIRAYAKGGRFAEAGELAEQLQKNSADANFDGATQAEILAASAEAHYARGDLDAAARDCERALAADNPADQSLPSSAIVSGSARQFGTRFADEYGLKIAELRSESLRERPPKIEFHHRAALRRGVRLARMHVGRGDPAAARRYHESLLAVAPYVTAGSESGETLFINSFWVLDDMMLSLVEWGEVALALGDLKLAEALLEIAGQRTRALETENNQQRLLVQAGLNELLGAEDEALRRHVIAAELARELYGVGSPRHVDAINALAGYHWRQDDRERAVDLYEHAVTSWVDFMTRALLTLPESQALVLLEQHRPPVGQLLSTLGHDPRSAARAYAAVWLTKGQVTMLLAERQRFRQEIGDDPLLQDLETVRQRLARLALSPLEEGQAEEERVAELAAVTRHKEQLESKLAEKSAVYRRARASIEETPADLVRRLPAATAVVDFRESRQFVPRRLSPTAFDPNGILDLRLWNSVQRHYEAFVIRPTGDGKEPQVAWVDLGPADLIDEAILAWRTELLGGDPEERSSENALPVGQNLAAWLKTHLWEPLAPHLDGAETVLLLPDQRLGFLPWNALPGREPGRYLIEDFALATAPSARWLLRTLAAPAPDGEGLLLLAAVDYDRQTPGETSPRATALATRTSGQTGDPLRSSAQNAWPALPGTAAEAREILQLWQGKPPVLLGGAGASETAVRRKSTGIRYLHLATHGFFADEAFRSWLNWDVAGQTVFGSTADGTLARRHPGLLTGMVLAGANADAKEQSNLPDGILTAEEALGLDLAQAELVTLSACQTGLGATADGEGVFGLQRAFHLAGARTVAASLWRVDDDATRVLMVEFYRNLWERKLGRLESLRQAQLAMLQRFSPENGTLRGVGGVRKVEPSSHSLPPALWAAFVLSGDWR